MRFVDPVRSYTVISQLLHIFGSYLNFNIDMHTKQRRMQRLVTIRLGHRNIIFKSPGKGLYTLCTAPKYDSNRLPFQ